MAHRRHRTRSLLLAALVAGTCAVAATFFHFATSSWMIAANSSGRLATGSPPSAAMCSRMSGSATMRTISARVFSMMFFSPFWPPDEPWRRGLWCVCAGFWPFEHSGV